MKVLVLSHMYPSVLNEMNGIFVHEQVKALVAKGVEVQVVSPVIWAPFPINYLSFKWKNYSNIPKRTIYEGINIWYIHDILLFLVFGFLLHQERECIMECGIW
jgi:hypothetical protein